MLPRQMALDCCSLVPLRMTGNLHLYCLGVNSAVVNAYIMSHTFFNSGDPIVRLVLLSRNLLIWGKLHNDLSLISYVGGRHSNKMEQRWLRTGLVPEDMPIEGSAEQCELFFGSERDIRSRRDSLLVQPIATLVVRSQYTKLYPSRDEKHTVSSLFQREMTSRTQTHRKPIPTRFARRSPQEGSEAIS